MSTEEATREKARETRALENTASKELETAGPE